MFAIVTISGKQYKVSKGDMVTVDRLDGKVGDVVTLDRVLLYSDGKKVSVGKPTVAGVTIKAKIIKQTKGEKVDVRRFKSKVRHRRHIGFRPRQTVLEILSVGKA